jgi:thioesterase domain-containing protein
MFSRMPAKVKVSLTLSADVVALVDRDAKHHKGTRSSVVELWLRRAATAEVTRGIEDATAAYYRSLRSDQREEDESLSKALSAAARRISYDDSIAPRPRRVSR